MSTAAGMTATPVIGILRHFEEVEMRFQDPELEKVGSKREYWQIRPYMPVVKRDGSVERKRKAIRIGWCDEMTRSKAREEKQRIMATINSGVVVLQSQVDFSALCDRYEAARLPQLSSTTRAKYSSHIKNHLRPAFGAMKLCEIDKPTVEAWLAGKCSTLDKWTRLDLRTVLSAIFRQAEEWKIWTGQNPARGAGVGRGDRRRPKRMFTDAQIMSFLWEIADTRILPAYKSRILAEICLITGLRVSEALGLRWEDFDAAAQTVRVERRWARGDMDQPKTDVSRRVRKIGAMADELKLMRRGAKDEDQIFCRPDGGLPDDRDLQQHVFRPAAERAKIYHPGFGIHTMRRLSITWRQQEGATPVEAMRAAGHSKIDTTLMYTLTDERRESEVVERMAARIAPKAEGGPQ